ncbi:MAG TPA: sugar ABC transporter ATP-binding protein [Polyangia bacterium]|nr:sugar ABC transporter ATP-binding protein [Polyangia bacterium]
MTAVELRGVGKRFPGVRALEDVSFSIAAGSCHALCGENGAGKSTLGKLLAGIQRPDAGQIHVHGAAVRFESPRDALRAGIGMVHQELAFCENLSVAENLCLGALPRRGPFVSHAEMARQARAQLAAIQADGELEVDRVVGDLTVAEQQVLQIAAAVGSGARIIIFDEPTSSLSQHEADRLYALIDRLRARGTTCIYVSHRMPEIFRLCDTITVLRDGRHVLTAPARELDEGALVEAMIGRRLDQFLPPPGPARAAGDVLLRVEGLSSPPRFRDVSFQVAAGEVVGLAGLVGAGRSEVARAIFGLDPDARGQVEVGGVPLPPGSPVAALRAGVGLVPEDRKRQGLVLDLSGQENVVLPILPEVARWGWLRPAAARARVEAAFARLKVKIPDLTTPAIGLSGGNQQKLVLAKWLAARCRMLILDEPTRGVDVGAKAEIHALIRELADAGTAILLITSELPELLALSTRFLVMRDGHLAGELPGGADQAALMRLMAGGA